MGFKANTGGVAGIRATNFQISDGWHKSNSKNYTMVGIRATTCQMVVTRATPDLHYGWRKSNN